MKKFLFLSFILMALIFVLVGCGSKSITEGFEVKDDKLYIEGLNETSTFVCEVKNEKGEIRMVNVTNGDSVDVLELGLGTFVLRAKQGSLDWSKELNYESKRLLSPKDVEIKDNKIFFSEVNGADVYYVYFEKDGKEESFEVEKGSLLSKLGLKEGIYNVSVAAGVKNNAGAISLRSPAVTFTASLKELDVPTGLTIEDGYVFFDVMGATNNYVLKFEGAGETFERDVTSGGAELSELLIPVGTYKVSIKAKGDGVTYKDSSYSTPIDFTKVQTFMELKEKDLINAGYIKWMGRTYYNEDKKVNEVYHSASGFELFFKGTMVSAVITATNYNSSTYRPCIVIVVDDDFDNAQTLFLNKASQEVVLVSDNNDLEEHKVDLYKRSESIDSHIAIELIKTDGIFIKKIVNKELKMEFIAASSSTGYGNLGSPSSSGKTTENSDCLRGFAFLTAQALNADVNIFSASGWGCAFSKWTTPNTANVPTEYRKVDFNSSVPWIHGYYIPDVVVVNLGTNDWSYINAATTDAEKDSRLNQFQSAYIDFLKYLHDIYPDAQIIVLYGLMNESSIYDITESIVTRAKLAIPNLVSIKINGDAGGYNSHPSLASHKQIAEKLTQFIKETLNLE